MAQGTWVNKNQSPEERKFKYKFLRELGERPDTARKRRDWRWSKFARHYDLDKGELLAFARQFNEHYTIFGYHPEELEES